MKRKCLRTCLPTFSSVRQPKTIFVPSEGTTKDWKGSTARKLATVRLKTVETRRLLTSPFRISHILSPKEISPVNQNWPQTAELRLRWCATEAKNAETVDEKLHWLNTAYSACATTNIKSLITLRELKNVALGFLSTPEVWTPANVLRWSAIIALPEANKMNEFAGIQQSLADIIICVALECETVLASNSDVSCVRASKLKRGWCKIRDENSSGRDWAPVLQICMSYLAREMQHRVSNDAQEKEPDEGTQLDSFTQNCLLHAIVSFLDDDDTVAVHDPFLIEVRKSLQHDRNTEYDAFFLLDRLVQTRSHTLKESIELIDVVACRALQVNDTAIVELATGILRHEVQTQPKLTTSLAQSVPGIWLRLLQLAEQHHATEKTQVNMQTMLLVFFEEIKNKRRHGEYDPKLLNEVRKISESAVWMSFAEKRDWKLDASDGNRTLCLDKGDALWHDIADSSSHLQAQDHTDAALVMCPQCETECDLQGQVASESATALPPAADNSSQSQESAGRSIKPRRRRRGKRRGSKKMISDEHSPSTTLEKSQTSSLATDKKSDPTTLNLIPGESVVIKEMWRCLHCDVTFDREILQLPLLKPQAPCLPERDVPTLLLPWHPQPTTQSRKIGLYLQKVRALGLRTKASIKQLHSRTNTLRSSGRAKALCNIVGERMDANKGEQHEKYPGESASLVTDDQAVPVEKKSNEILRADTEEQADADATLFPHTSQNDLTELVDRQPTSPSSEVVVMTLNSFNDPVDTFGASQSFDMRTSPQHISTSDLQSTAPKEHDSCVLGIITDDTETNFPQKCANEIQIEDNTLMSQSSLPSFEVHEFPPPS